VKNPDGLTSTLTGGFTYDPPAPKLTRVDPDHGPTGGGIAVTVYGLNFLAGDEARIGGAALTGTVEVQGNRITGTLPAGAAGAADVEVRRGGAVVVTAHGLFTYSDPPVILRFHPTEGAAAGGSLIVVQGQRFITGAQLKIGGVNATGLSTGPATIVGAVPPGTDGASVEVKVVNPTGETAVATGTFTYRAYGIFGSAKQGGLPIEQGWVRAFGAEHEAEVGAGALGPQGVYFTRLPGPGAYKAVVVDTGPTEGEATWTGDGRSLLRSSRLDVPGAVRHDFDSVGPGLPIFGTVKDGAGAPVVGARIEIDDAEFDDLTAVTESVAGGAYLASVPAVGRYRVRASFHPAGLGTVFFPGVRAKALAEPVDPAAETATDIVLAQGGFISGTVHDAAGPLAFASLDLDDLEAGDAGRFFSRADGSFRFAVPPGAYRLKARPLGSAGTTGPAPSGEGLLAATAPIAVLAGDDPAPFDLPLGELKPVRGRVLLDANGLAVPGARVTAYHYALAGEVSFARAAEDGGYALYLPSGDHKLLAEAPLLASDAPHAAAYLGDRFERRRSRTIGAGGTGGTGATGVDLRLREGAIVEGRVLKTGGAPVAGVRVAIEDAALGGEYLEARTHSDGAFAAAVRGDHKYKAYVDAGSPWFQLVGGVWNGGFVARLDAPEMNAGSGAVADFGDLQPATSAEVSGRVTDAASGAGVPGVSVLFWIHGDGPSYRAVSGHDGRYRASLPASPQGDAYVVEALADGLPFIREFMGGAHNGCGQGAPGAIIVVDGDTKTLDLALDEGASISGVVVDDASSDPVSDLFVQAWLRDDTSGSCCSSHSGLRSGVRADGTFTVRVPVGSWSIRAQPSADSPYPQFGGGYNWAGGSTTCLGGTTFNVTNLNAQLTGAEIRLR
jgi:hypothetical protein